MYFLKTGFSRKRDRPPVVTFSTKPRLTKDWIASHNSDWEISLNPACREISNASSSDNLEMTFFLTPINGLIEIREWGISRR